MSTTSAYAALLARLVSDITFYIDLLSFIFGTTGCIGNLITYSSRQMRQSAAALYLICAAISQLVTILVCVTIRLTHDHSGSNLQNQSAVFCKFRFYVAVSLPALASYYMFLATFDRFLCTSDRIRIRAWSQPKVAKRLAIVMLIVSIIMPIHIPIVYNIYNNVCQISPESVYKFIYASYLLIVVIFLPHMFMCIFSLLTIMALRKSRQRVNPAVIGNNIQNRRRSFELKFIRIIVVQVFISIVLSSLRFGSASYRNIVFVIVPPTTDQRAAEVFAETLGSSLYFLDYAISFYVAFLSSKFFRERFYGRILYFYRRYARQLVQRHISY